MPNLDLTGGEHGALLRLVKRTLGDRYPLSPQLGPLKAILAKLALRPGREPYPPKSLRQSGDQTEEDNWTLMGWEGNRLRRA